MSGYSGNKRFIIMRHEMTRENKMGLIQGQSIGGTLLNHEINPEKIEWCKKKILAPAIIISSSAARSVRSANLLSKVLGIPVYKSSLFVQRRWGDVEGMLVRDIKKSWYCKNSFLSDADKLSSGAESLEEVTKRAKKAFEYLKNVDARTVIVVTHDEFSNYLINEILVEGLFKRSLMFNQAHMIDCKNGEVVKVVLHANIHPEAIKHYVLLRQDASAFMIDKVGLRILRSHGVAIVKEDIDKFRNMSLINGVIVGGDLVLVDDLLIKYPNVKIISKIGKGVDNIRLLNKELVEKGVLCIANTPHCNERTVAEFTTALILNAARKIFYFSSQINSDVWCFEFTPNWSRVVVGILGLGEIGREIVKILKSLGFSIIVWTINPEKHKDFIRDNEIVLVKSVDEICLISDIITLHVRLTEKTDGLIKLKQLKAMKARRGYIINCSRSGLIDYQDLRNSLENDWISGAALDVWPEEPIKSKWLKDLAVDPRIVATPHVAGDTKSSVNKTISLCAYNIAWFLCGFPTIVSAVPLEELE